MIMELGEVPDPGMMKVVIVEDKESKERRRKKERIVTVANKRLRFMIMKTRLITSMYNSRAGTDVQSHNLLKLTNQILAGQNWTNRNFLDNSDYCEQLPELFNRCDRNV